MKRIKADVLQQTVEKIFLNEGVNYGDAKLLANIITRSSIDGYQSHGINRVPMMIDYIRRGIINLKGKMVEVNSGMFFKVFDANNGLGPVNAWNSTGEAIKIAKEKGMGLVALKNNTHWQRAGTYGWKAVNEGMIFICWTNTIPNLPPYGSNKNLLGNNPFVIAIPAKENNLVLDMSLSQFSYGKIAGYARLNKELPEFGGYDENGNLTKNASVIREKGTHLPIGFWKGSALSLMLDLLAAILSGGKTTREIGLEANDAGLSQVFVAIDPDNFGSEEFRNRLIKETLLQLQLEYDPGKNGFHYPGSGSYLRRKENLAKGIPVEDEILQKINELVLDRNI